MKIDVGKRKQLELLVLGLLLSITVGAYLYFATAFGHVFFISFGLLMVLSLIIGLALKKIWPPVIINCLYNVVLLVDLLVIKSSDSTVVTSSQTCMDVCIAGPIFFQIVKVIAIISFSVACTLVIRLLQRNKIINDFIYRVLTICSIIFSVLLIIISCFTF